MKCVYMKTIEIVPTKHDVEMKASMHAYNNSYYSN